MSDRRTDLCHEKDHIRTEKMAMQNLYWLHFYDKVNCINR